MADIILIRHASGAPGLRLFGLGPNLLPRKGLSQLRDLLDKHTFWAQKRSYKELRQALAGSTIVISLWKHNKIIGFGRATSDGIFRAVLWDIVVSEDSQGQGLGSKVVKALLSSSQIKNVERIYLMTTKSSNFYEQLGFEKCISQSLLKKK